MIKNESYFVRTRNFPRTAISILTGILDADSQHIRELEDSDFADDPEAIAVESHNDIQEDE
jgi:hypothetical protein